MKRIAANFVYQQLELLKPSKATGLDGISARLLEDAASTVSALLTTIVNCSISTSIVPAEWKHAKVVSLHKDGDETSMDIKLALCLSCRLHQKSKRGLHRNS